MADVHNCWGPHQFIGDPHACRCEIATDHDHAEYLAAGDEGREVDS